MDKEKGFFCVVYFILKTEDRKDKEGNVRTVITEGRTAYYHSQWNPSKLANALTQPFLWMKIYLQKEDYHICSILSIIIERWRGVCINIIVRN